MPINRDEMDQIERSSMVGQLGGSFRWPGRAPGVGIVSEVPYGKGDRRFCGPTVVPVTDGLFPCFFHERP